MNPLKVTWLSQKSQISEILPQASLPSSTPVKALTEAAGLWWEFEFLQPFIPEMDSKISFRVVFILSSYVSISL